MNHVAIRAHNLSKEYAIGARRQRYRTLRETLTGSLRRPGGRARECVWALKDVSFEIEQGTVLGVIGRNGAGKSTLLKILSRITEPTRGHAEIRGKVGSLLEVGTGFHNELTGRENIFLNGAILGMKRVEIARKFDEIVAFAEIERFIDTPVKHYSSGMYLRLAFAVAAHLEPSILLVDEVIAVGDAAFQKKCLGKMDDVATHGRTVLFVSHNMGAVRSLCTRGLFLHDGEVRHVGRLPESIAEYYKELGSLPPAGDTPVPQGPRFGPITVNGETICSIVNGQPFTVSTTLHGEASASGFTIFCMLEDMHGRGIACAREDSHSLAVEAGAACYAIDVNYPPLWVSPGLYSIYFKVLFRGDFAAGRYLSDKVALDVSGVSSPNDSVLHPLVNWSVCAEETYGNETTACVGR